MTHHIRLINSCISFTDVIVWWHHNKQAQTTVNGRRGMEGVDMVMRMRVSMWLKRNWITVKHQIMIQCFSVEVKYHRFWKNYLAEQIVYTLHLLQCISSDWTTKRCKERKKKKQNCTTGKCTVFTEYSFFQNSFLCPKFLCLGNLCRGPKEVAADA